MKAKDIIVLIISILIFFTYTIPAFMIYHTGQGPWGLLYIGIVLLTAWWIAIVADYLDI